MLKQGKLYKIHMPAVDQFDRESPLDGKIIMVTKASKVKYCGGRSSRDKNGGVPWITEHYTFLCEDDIYEVDLQPHVYYDVETHTVEVYSPNQKSSLDKTMCTIWHEKATAKMYMVNNNNGPIFERLL